MLPTDAPDRLAALAERHFEGLLRFDPIAATRIGDRRFEALLPDLSRARRAERTAELEALARDLSELDREALDETGRVTADVLAFQVEKSLDERRHGLDLMAVNQMYGPQVALLQLATQHPMDADGRASYLDRLAAFPASLESWIDQLDEGVERGIVGPRIVTDRVLSQLDDLLIEPLSQDPLVHAAERVDESERESFAEAVEEAVREHARPAFARMRAYLADTYRAHATATLGLGALPGGPAAYRFRIRAHTTLDLTAEEVHAMGLSLVTSFEERLAAIAAGSSHLNDVPGYLRELRTAPSNTYATREELLADAQRLLARATHLLPRWFGRLPHTRCVAEPIESFREKDAPAGYYQAAPLDGSRPAIYAVNLSRPGERMRSNLTALSLHEAVPGHHLQIALARESTHLPRSRRTGGVTAFVEGWALYAERLGEEMGLYEDEREIAGMLSYQIWRAARLVVDTGIHALGWDREQAIGYFREHVAIAETEIENEIDRYVLWPGQALAYMVGCEHIAALRADAAKRLGAKFDLRAFHDEVLRHGAVPLSVLTSLIDAWVAAR